MRRRARIRLKRRAVMVGCAVGGPLVLLLAVRLAWGWEAGARLANVQSEIAEKHYRVSEAEYARGVVPADKNAVTALTAATAVVNVEARPRRGFGGGEERFFGGPMMRMRGFGRGEFGDPRKVVAENRQALGELDAAVRRPLAVWEKPLTATLRGNDESLGVLQLGSVVGSAGQLAHQEHRDGEAVARAQELFEMSRILEAEPSMTAHLDACWVRMMGAAMIEQMVGELAIGSGAGAANPEAVRRLVGSMMDDGAFIAHFSTACEHELAVTSEAMNAQGQLGSWWIRPMQEDDVAVRLQRVTDFIPVARAGVYDASKGLWRGQSQTYLAQVRSVTVTGAVDEMGMLRMQVRALADERAAAVLLAARWFAAEHGAAAVNAEALVPGYLERVPEDPFARAGTRLRYRVDPEGVTVWSVGENGKDEEGKISERVFGGRYGQPDLVYGAAWREAVAAAVATMMAPATQPVSR